MPGSTSSDTVETITIHIRINVGSMLGQPNIQWIQGSTVVISCRHYSLAAFGCWGMNPGALACQPRSQVRPGQPRTLSAYCNPRLDAAEATWHHNRKSGALLVWRRGKQTTAR